MTGNVHRLVADTDALIAYARLDCWDVLCAELDITTTTKCYRELGDHTRLDPGETYDTAANERKDAAQRVIDAIDDPDCTINQQYCGSSERLGEHSIAKLVSQHADHVVGILMMDSGIEERAEGGRAYVRRKLDLDELGVGLPALGTPIALLVPGGHLTETEACANINRLSELEGWTSWSALRRIWEGVPLDCDEATEFS